MSQKKLTDLGIDIDSRVNMIWAPNRGHTVPYAQRVWQELQNAKSAGEVEEILRRLAREFLR